MLRLTHDQMASLGADARLRYEARLGDEMSRAHPDRAREDVQARVVARVQAAVDAGLTDEAAVTRYVRTTFDLDPMPAPPAPPLQPTRSQQRGDPSTPSSRQVGSAVQSCQSFVRVELVDDFGDPVEGERFSIELPDGTTRTGLTDGEGTALIVGIPAGSCRVTFPDTPTKP